MSHDELAKCPCTFSMNHPLRDTFSVEVGKEIEEMEILEEDRSMVANRL